jgi:hypothetical protein
MNLIAWLRMDLQENMLLTRYDWQFNAAQNPEITETIEPRTPDQDAWATNTPYYRGATKHE